MATELFDQHAWLYADTDFTEGGLISLDDFAVQHLQPLRMQQGDEIVLADGRGSIALATLRELSKKTATAQVLKVDLIPKPSTTLELYIGLTKNNTRNEWVLEKATELGASKITPLITHNTQKYFLKHKRAQKILISSMLQSRGAYLPVLSEELQLSDYVASDSESIVLSHCYDSGHKKNILDYKPGEALIVKYFVGPEGDFSPTEIKQLKSLGATEVSLGNRRLRTETAAIAGLSVLSLKIS